MTRVHYRPRVSEKVMSLAIELNEVLLIMEVRGRFD